MPTNNKSIEIVRSYEKEKDQIYYRINRKLIVTTKIVFLLFSKLLDLSLNKSFN